MPITCVAWDCTNRMKKDSSISFHRFPHKNPQLLQKWIQAIRRENWQPTQYSYICSKHFDDSCFVVRPGKSGHRLHEHAVPSIFNFPEHLQKKDTKRKPPAKRKMPEPKPKQESPSKVVRCIGMDHTYSSTKKCPSATITKLSKELKAIREKVRRRDRRIHNLNDLFKSLKEKQFVADKKLQLLQHNFSGTAKHLFQNQQKNQQSGKHENRYSEETKQFAMTLHYYSPKAYEFTRKVLALPHASSIRGWAASVDCEPGYLTNVIKLLGEIVDKKGWMSDAVLMVDAMALHKGTVWDPKTKRYVGTVDYGTAIPENEDELATEALVFMVVGMTGHWKHPIAYVLQNKCSAAVQAQLIRDCIGLLHGEGIDVIAVVFDGTFTNQQTAKRLGCKLKVSDIQPWFPHPQKPRSRIYIIFDVCHMLKLMRNLLGDYKVICNEKMES